MLRELHSLWRACFVVIDLSVSATLFLLAYWLRFRPEVASWLGKQLEPPQVEAYLSMLPALYGVLFFTNSYFRLYQARRISKFAQEFVDILKSNTVAILLLMTFCFLNRNFSYSRSVVAIFACLNPVGLFLFRFGIRSVLRVFRAHGYNLRHILIVGTGRPAQALLHRLRLNPWTGLRTQGFVSISAERVGTSIHGVPVLGTTKEIGKVLKEHAANQVFITLPLHLRKEIEDVLEQLSHSFVAIRMVPDLGFLLNHRVTMDFDGLSIVNLWENHLGGWNVFAKRCLDLGISLLAIIFFSPAILLISALILLLEGGPIFYVQRRMGHDGRIFPMIKFRTMSLGAENDTKFTQPNDERCTGLGRFLRRTSVDELPQLFNVILGHMSLVGPRPERPVFIESFRKSMPRYMLRHKVKAGMTGWAQVNGWRGATSLKKRLQYDLYYLHNWSLWFDLKILALTFIRGWTHRNAY